MGFSMLKTWKTKTEHRLAVVEPVSELRARASSIGSETFAASHEMPVSFSADIVVIATKPEAVAQSIQTCGPFLADDGLLVSVAAGVNFKAILSHAPRNVGIVRCMPNTPATIGEAMTVCCPTGRVTSEQRQITEQLMSAMGKTVFVEDEVYMDAVTAVSGSGPAYVFHFIEALAEAGEAAGLDPSLALMLSKQTVLGAARLANEIDSSPAELRKQVTSPNGTTEAALEVLMNPRRGIVPILIEAVAAARARSLELST